jgi:hypothetical protein
MKVKFITAIYARLAGSDLGGRHARGGHYKFSLLSLLKMTNADFICYTSEDEIYDLEMFFYHENNISKDQLKFVVFDLFNTKFKNLINNKKNLEQTRKSDRCVEVQYSKFNWWWNEDKTYDYYFWIDAGLSHCGLVPNKFLPHEGTQRRYYECTLFQNDFLKNLIEFTGDKIFIMGKENDRNYWSGTVNPKYYTEFDRSIHIIGGLFGGKKENWDWLVSTFEDYVKQILEDNDEGIPMEEQIMTLMYFNHKDRFERKHFDIWWCPDNCPQGTDMTLFDRNKSFYKILLELNKIDE